MINRYKVSRNYFFCSLYLLYNRKVQTSTHLK
nr:MAG TPA: hypothetical protein [Caudoviricetes sp.]